MVIHMRSILKLSWANIKHEKSSFIGVVLLVFIIVLSGVPTISNAYNEETAIDEACERANLGDVTIMIAEDLFTDDMRQVLKDSTIIDSIEESTCLSIVGSLQLNGEEKDFLTHIRSFKSDTRVYNSDCSEYYDSFDLREGELLLPYKVKDYDGVQIGATITIPVGDTVESFTIRGFYDDPIFRPRTFGFTCAVVSDHDYKRLMGEKSHIEDERRAFLAYDMLQVHLAEGTSFKIFSDEMKANSSIMSTATIIPMEHLRNSNMIYADMGSKILLIFLVLMFVGVLISMKNSINSAIEMNYVELGVLKSQGFSIMDIRMVFIVQYVLATLLGAILGLILAIPLTSWTVGLFETVTCILTSKHILLGKSLLFILILIMVSAACVFLSTMKVAKISPVRAIRGGGADVFFNSRFQHKISSKSLTLSLSWRQLLSNAKHYIGSVLIVGLLVFFMVSISVLTTGLDVDNIWGLIDGEITLKTDSIVSQERLEELEQVAREVDPKAYIRAQGYTDLLVDGEDVALYVNLREEDRFKTLKGRLPQYDNEVALGTMIAKTLDKSVGDTVVVQYHDAEQEFVVCGIFDSAYDYGMVIQLMPSSAQLLGFDDYDESYIKLSDSQLTAKVIERVSQLDGITATEYEVNENFGFYMDIVDILLQTVSIIVDVISLLFALVVAAMVCHRSFLRERKNIGIYKAVGFQVRRLRWEVAIRFGIVALVGALLGVVTALFLAKPLILSILQLVGLTNFVGKLSIMTYLIPVLIITIGFALFSYFFSRSIKKVQVRELITE